MDRPDTLILYTYWRSSAAYRVRIALNLKELPFESRPVHLVKNGGEQYTADYLGINPQGLVPTLVHGGRVITQSLAICEYLEECFPQSPLLPDEPQQRAWLRSLALQIACEIHPLNNLRVQKYLTAECGEALDTHAWMSHWMGQGFETIERQLEEQGGDDLTWPGGNPGLFECFLIPQVYNAERFAIDMAPFARIRAIVDHCSGLSAFRQAAPERQPDATPG